MDGFLIFWLEYPVGVYINSYNNDVSGKNFAVLPPDPNEFDHDENDIDCES